MPDVTQGLRQAAPVTQRSTVAGYISTNRPAPTTLSDPLFVIVPAFSADYSYGPCRWAALHGQTLPGPGAAVLVNFDDQGVPLVVWWDGTANFQPRALTANTTGLSSAQIDALFPTAPPDGSLLGDPTNAWALIRLAGSWYRTAALTHIP